MESTSLFTTKQVLGKVGIARNTLYKWLREGKIPDVYRDRNNFRLFSHDDVSRLIRYKNLVYKPTIGEFGKRAS